VDPALLILAEEFVACWQIAVLTLRVLATSALEQAFCRQGATEAVMASLPVVHWHFVSVRVQDVVWIAAVKQLREHDGRSAMDSARAEEERERRTAIAEVNFMLNRYIDEEIS